MLKVMLRLKEFQIGSRTAGKLLPQLGMSDGWMLLVVAEESFKNWAGHAGMMSG